MCGIFGYCGDRRAAPLVKEGLKRLEYRGYDSAGIATLDKGGFRVVRAKGRVDELGALKSVGGTVGIGHTRWATHGAPSVKNAHPHIFGRFAIVHNGIIENALSLKEECLARREKFSSDTDSEVIAHLLNFYYHGDIVQALKKTCARLRGAYALAILVQDAPQTIACARYKSPLVVAKNGRGEVFVSSDAPAISGDKTMCRNLRDGEYALIQNGNIRIFDSTMSRINDEFYTLEAQNCLPEKEGYKHYMRKEIDEIPFAMRNSIPNFASDAAFLRAFNALCHAEYIEIVACGTAFHSGLCAAYAFEKLCRVPCRVSPASEYRYRTPIVPKKTVVIAVSQSGETADTLAAAELAKAEGAYLLGITNVAYSSLTTVCNEVLFTGAGREIAVAATKSFNAQLTLLYALVTAIAQARGTQQLTVENLPTLSKLTLSYGKKIKAWVPHFLSAKCVFFLGRGADWCTAREGSLKLKEITYIPSEGYSAGELKHGTLALVDEHSVVVAIATQRSTAEKTMNAVHEVYARGAKVFLVTAFPEYCERKELAGALLVPACEEAFSPALSVIPLQLLAYYVSVALGYDPDKPRNLAKSVTVE